MLEKRQTMKFQRPYYGGVVARDRGVLKVGPATMGDATNPLSVYDEAHSRLSTPQPSSFERKMYDSNGKSVPNPADFSVPFNVRKIDYENTSAKNFGAVFHTIILP